MNRKDFLSSISFLCPIQVKKPQDAVNDDDDDDDNNNSKVENVLLSSNKCTKVTLISNHHVSIEPIGYDGYDDDAADDDDSHSGGDNKTITRRMRMRRTTTILETIRFIVLDLHILLAIQNLFNNNDNINNNDDILIQQCVPLN